MSAASALTTQATQPLCRRDAGFLGHYEGAHTPLTRLSEIVSTLMLRKDPAPLVTYVHHTLLDLLNHMSYIRPHIRRSGHHPHLLSLADS
jgi:hypothetical protein